MIGACGPRCACLSMRDMLDEHGAGMQWHHPLPWRSSRRSYGREPARPDRAETFGSTICSRCEAPTVRQGARAFVANGCSRCQSRTMKTLELRWVFERRRGERLDFVVSGRSLYKEFRRRGYDVVPRLGSKLVPVDGDIRDLLLLEKKGDTPTGRVALYFCPLCGDLGCGVVSVKLTRENAYILWSEFAWETDCNDHFQPIEKLGPYRFREAEYRQAILAPPGATPGR